MYWRFGLLFLLISLPGLNAKDVSVLVDVSGTMATYGSWQHDAKDLITGILSGNVRAPNWERKGDDGALAEFHTEGGDRIHLIRFGSVLSSVFPFFAPPDDLSSIEQLNEAFPVNAELFHQARTNKPLAICVGARLAAAKDGIGRLIVISDFLVDSDVTAEQQNAINEFESKARVETPLIFAWNRNPRVQVKLLRITGTSDSAVPLTGPALTVRITGAKLLDRPRRLVLSWALAGTDEEATYSVTIRDPKSGRTILSRTVLNASLLVPNPPSGKFVWQVVANLRGNRTASSAMTSLEIPSDNSFWAIAAVLLLLLCSIAAWWYSKRRKPSPEADRKEARGWTG
ncbi:MAG TPA: hypothetical protein VKX49_15990 [Bryobacteraceae bacterium]|jgi:hypothetical protein|nr:hypothetical protein [Bryobacteraceae bacterium]